MKQEKSFDISKQVVWEAYQRLYKLWNRMGIGKLFPATGAASGDSEEGWCIKAFRHSHRFRSDRSDGAKTVGEKSPTTLENVF